jgi:hypothetical protein
MPHLPPRRVITAALAYALTLIALTGCLPDGSGGDGDGVADTTASTSGDGTSGGGTSGGGTSGGGTSGGGTSGGGDADATASDAPENDPDAPRPDESASAPGWERAFNASPAGVRCDMSEAELQAAGAPSLTIGGATLYVGFVQLGQNQDPIFMRFDGGELRYCMQHEQEPPDGRAYGLTWDGGPTAYVVYTIAGGGSAFDAKGKGQWLDRYGDGGASAKVSFLGEVSVEDGELVRGTFIIAKKQDGKTNTHRPADAPIRLPSGDIEFHGDSAFQPMNPDKSIMACSGYPFSTLYRFSADLKTLRCSTSTNCASAQPCTP